MISSLPQTGMPLLFVLGCIFFPLSFAVLCWALQNHSNLPFFMECCARVR